MAASTLPFSMVDSPESFQLRLAMFHRANPEIAWAPANYGFARTYDVDGKYGTRTYDSIESYMNFRFGKGVITNRRSAPGIQINLVVDLVKQALRGDTPYADNVEIASPYYAQIMGKTATVQTLPKATPGIIPVSCAFSCGVTNQDPVVSSADTSRSGMSGFGDADGLSWHDQASIFGHTYQGVPNPQVPYEHPYPTRYHGPIFTEPRFGLPFESNPMSVAPYSGLESIFNPLQSSPVSMPALKDFDNSFRPVLDPYVDAAMDNFTKKMALMAGGAAVALGAFWWYRTQK